MDGSRRLHANDTTIDESFSCYGATISGLHSPFMAPVNWEVLVMYLIIFLCLRYTNLLALLLV